VEVFVFRSCIIPVGGCFTADYLLHTGRALEFVYAAFGYHLTGWYRWLSNQACWKGGDKSFILVVITRFLFLLAYSIGTQSIGEPLNAG
jgi:hypothetical protein